jgi:hypothetical protein
MSLWLCALNPESQWEYKLENTQKKWQENNTLYRSDKCNNIIATKRNALIKFRS